jgi:hypothetical protein
MALPLIPFALKAGAAGMTMIYSTATGQYVIGAATAAWMAAKGVAVGAAIAAAATAMAAPVMTFIFPPWYAPLLTPVGLACAVIAVLLIGGSYGFNQYKKGKQVNIKGALKDTFGWLKYKVLRIN